MKKIFLALVIAAVLGAGLASPAMAGDSINAYCIMDGTSAIAASSNYSGTCQTTGGAISMERVSGYFALDIRDMTGDGTMKAEYQCSSNGQTWAEPEDASDIVTGWLKTSGPGSDGTGYVLFEPEVTKYIRIVLTETGGADTITPTVYMIVQ